MRVKLFHACAARVRGVVGFEWLNCILNCWSLCLSDANPILNNGLTVAGGGGVFVVFRNKKKLFLMIPFFILN